MYYRFTFLQDEPERARPIVIALVGPNGSGKSSITNLLRLTNVNVGDSRYSGRIAIDQNTGEVLLPVVNPDEIAKAIKANRPELDMDVCNLKAAQEAEEIREVFAQAGLDFAFETVGSTKSKVEFLRRLKRQGYFVAVVFVGTEDPAINVRRVEQRHRNGGHDVPADKVVARYTRTMSQLPQYLELAAFIAVYDNSEDLQPDDPSGPKLLLVKREGAITTSEHGHQCAWLKKALGDLA